MTGANGTGPEHRGWETDRLLFGGLAGLATAGVFELVGKERPLDGVLTGALLFFASAIPLLTVSLLAVPSGAQRVEKHVWQYCLDLLGVVAAVVGFALLFFHLSTVAGAIFSGCAAAGVVLTFIRQRG
jgi:hypothetical protein